MTPEQKRLQESDQRIKHWKRWGPYLSERAWGTVREDYSATGDAWDYFPHDHARSRAYRWNEDGIAGISDRRQNLCFALALWNEQDPILKERLFGLTGNEANHGEDVKECYYYLDNTPTHSYMKYLYKYPRAAYPYEELIRVNRSRSKNEPEYELVDTGVFEGNRYFDVFVEYAKADVDDICIRITVANRGDEPANLRLIPTLWFRNTWSWLPQSSRPMLAASEGRICATSQQLGEYELLFQGNPELLFTENDTNYARLYAGQNPSPYVKDAFHRYVIHGETEAINPAATGTKAGLHYRLSISPRSEAVIRLRLRSTAAVLGSSASFGSPFESLFESLPKTSAGHKARRRGSGQRFLFATVNRPRPARVFCLLEFESRVLGLYYLSCHRILKVISNPFSIPSRPVHSSISTKRP